MKYKFAFLLIFFVCIFVSSVSSLTITTKNSSNYAMLETGIVSLKGVFYEPITDNMVELRRNNVLVPIDHQIQNFGNEYILWFIAPQISNNYTLIIKDVATTENGSQIKKDIKIDVNVSSNLVDYNVRPETINPDGNFSIIINSFLDDNKDISVSFPNNHDVTIKPGENELKLNTSSIYGEKRVDMIIGKYSIPFLISGTAKTQYETSDYNITISPTRYNDEEIIFFDGYSFNFTVLNKLDKEITKIRIIYDEELFSIIPAGEFKLSAKAEKEFKVTLKKTVRSDIEKQIVVRYNNINVTLPVELEIDEDNIISNTSGNSSIIDDFQNSYCEELRGVVCSVSEQCSVATKTTRNGECCTGFCSEKESSSGTWIGILLFVIVIGVLGYIGLKYKKTPKTTPENKTKLSEELLKKNIP